MSKLTLERGSHWDTGESRRAPHPETNVSFWTRPSRRSVHNLSEIIAQQTLGPDGFESDGICRSWVARHLIAASGISRGDGGGHRPPASPSGASARARGHGAG